MEKPTIHIHEEKCILGQHHLLCKCELAKGVQSFHILCKSTIHWLFASFYLVITLPIKKKKSALYVNCKKCY